LKKLEELSREFRKFFRLSTSPVAVKFSEDKLEGQRPGSPSLFCDFVRKAARDEESYLITEEDLKNFVARVILGFTEPKYVDIYPRVKPARTKSVLVAPLEKMNREPDVVLVISDPARMMSIVQVLYRATRARLEANMTCEGQAVAGEATALPYMEKKPNLTLLCGGARGIAGYKEDELIIGIPYSEFTKLVDLLVKPKLTAALCGCIMDEIPKHLKEAFVGLGFDKGTDHFYGDFEGKIFRVYLNKDERGIMASAIVHYPMKFKSKEEAQKFIGSAKKLLARLEGESNVVPRENWLDLVLMVEFPEGLEKLALDLARFNKAIKDILVGFAGVVDEIAS
jgi:uncharacterized protein (DUF169 family)